MSRLTATGISRHLATASRTVAATAPRTFTSSAFAQRSATEAVTDSLKKADRTVSDKIVDGISAGGELYLYLYLQPGEDHYPHVKVVIQYFYR